MAAAPHVVKNAEFESKHHRGAHGRFGAGVSKPKLLKRDERAVAQIGETFTPRRIGSPQYAAEYTAGIRQRIRPETVGAFHGLARALRRGDTSDERIGKLDAAMAPTEHDLVLTRHVSPQAFGLKDAHLPELKQLLTGRKIVDRAYTPGALHQEPQPGGITMHIAVPKGTRALVAGDNEMWLDRDSEFAVHDVYANGHGGYDVHMTVLPKAAPRAAKKPTKKVDGAPAKRATKATTQTKKAAEKKVTEAAVTAAKPEPQVLTGSDSRWWESITTDTGWDNPAPAKNLTLYSGKYTVKDGWVYRVDGVSYLIEGSGNASDTVGQAQLLQRFHATLPAEASQHQRAYHWLTGRNPDDDYWAERYNRPDFQSAFTAGDGSTYAWKKVAGLSYDESLRHEFGHNVSNAMRGRGLHAEGDAWRAASQGPDARRDVSDLTVDPQLAYEFKIAPQFDPSREFPYGVTTYGKSSVTEDYAEATALYLHGRIGTGRLTKDGPVQPLFFRDLFPARAAVLDQTYPSVAHAQLAELRRLGR